MLSFHTLSAHAFQTKSAYHLIHYKHFNAKFQHLALVLRANILPKPNQSKFFDFFDLKVIFLLYTNKVNFSISYVILLNMINANLVDYMPYGLLITAILKLFHIELPENQSTLADSHITTAHIRPQVSLIMCEPQESHPTLIPAIVREEDVYLANFQSVRLMFEEQKLEMKRLKEENTSFKNRVTYLEGRVAYLEGLAASTIGNNGIIDMYIMNAYQVPITDDLAMIHELEDIGVETSGQGLENLPDLIHVFGDDVGNATG